MDSPKVGCGGNIADQMRRASFKRGKQQQPPSPPLPTPPPQQEQAMVTKLSPESGKNGEETRHFSHLQHPLCLLTLPDLYNCSGCKELGAGARYKCNECNYDLHDFCAKAPPTMTHPFHSQHQLIFYSKPSGDGFLKSKCDVCGKTFKGFAYRCSVCSFSIHPSCGKLPMELVKCKQHLQHTLKLLSGSPRGTPYTCQGCGKKGTSWVYYCRQCDLYLDVRCAKVAINGMAEYNIVIPVKHTKFERAARFVGQVVQIFVEGLLEGLGDNLADILLNNIAKGSGNIDLFK